MLPRLLITSDTEDFDEQILQHFQEEGFQLWYLPYTDDRVVYDQRFQHLTDSLEPGERYAIVGYGDAAAICLDAAVAGPMPKLCALVAYYPPSVPSVSMSFPPALSLIIHLSASQAYGTQYPSYRYPATVSGFAESDLEEFDKTAASLAWSRTLSCLRSGFGIQNDLGPICDDYARVRFETRSAEEATRMMVPTPYVNHVPTMTGGMGSRNLQRFYHNFFVSNNPSDLKRTLLSRTIGVDRVVDELLVTFTHTVEMPWLLPGIPPTDRKVELILVSIVCIRGDKLYHEHVHWDQATVLLQVGLLDPKYIPPSFKSHEAGREKEVQRLPVLGAEAARKAVDEHAGKSNILITNW